MSLAVNCWVTEWFSVQLICARTFGLHETSKPISHTLYQLHDWSILSLNLSFWILFIRNLGMFILRGDQFSKQWIWIFSFDSDKVSFHPVAEPAVNVPSLFSWRVGDLHSGGRIQAWGQLCFLKWTYCTIIIYHNRKYSTQLLIVAAIPVFNLC